MTLAPRLALRAALASSALAALVVAGPAMANPAAAPCGAGQLAGKVRQTSGAAGTTAVSIAIRNTSPAACALRGFPRLKLRNAAGPLPTRVRHGGVALLERPVTTVTLAPGARASLLLTYSNVPTGNEVTCRQATRLVVILGDGRGRFSLPFDAAPCNRGTLRESPFLAGLQGV
jgi:hypothetical protein